MNIAELMRSQPILRGALIAPTMVALVFVLFNLTSAIDPAKATAALKVATVNLDEGLPTPAGPFRLADQIVSGLRANLPFALTLEPTEDAARHDLDQGWVSAAVVFPADFSRAIAEGRPVTVRVLNSDHLSVMETQVGNALPGQLQSALTIAVGAMRAVMAVPVPLAAKTPNGAPEPEAAAVTETPRAPEPAGTPQAPVVRVAPAPAPIAANLGGPKPPAVPVPKVEVRELADAMAPLIARAEAQAAAVPQPPVAAPDAVAPIRPPAPVQVTVAKLHAAPGYRALQAPFVLSFAGWMSGMIGGVLLFIGTRTMLNRESIAAVAAARIGIPIVASGFASLVAVLLVASVATGWGNFAELFAYRWLLTAGIAAFIIAAFALLGFAGFLVTVPLVFYQGALGGALAPSDAAPAWLSWLNDAVPLPALTTGLRTLLIGGPDGSVPWGAAAVLLATGMLATWFATVVGGRFSARNAKGMRREFT